jgi:ABC-type phosphate transport system substrate-binding protein
MMKRSLIVATFLVASGGAVAVGANSASGMRGSDTLFDITSQMFKSCPGIASTSLYQGGGSGTGQSAMVAGTQQVSPMSRFMNNGASICTADGGGGVLAVTSAEGLVIGLDGVQIVGSKRTLETDDGGTGVACHQVTNDTCSTNPTPAPGSAAIDTTVTYCNGLNAATPAVLDGPPPCAAGVSTATYTFNGWRDILRVLLAGFSNVAPATGTNAAAWAARDCGSATRLALANNYGAFFENNCAPQAGDTTGNCVAVRHVFRRDDFSGTTDTMVSLLGLPSIVNPETTGNLVSGGQAGVTTNHTGANPFCNAVRPAYVFPAATAPTCLQGTDATFDPTSKTTIATCAGQTAVNGVTTRETAVYRSTMQDNDPIRRTCAGSGTSATAAAEDACSHSGDLGLVLPMNDVPEETLATPRTNADRYNATACIRKVTSVTAPEVYDAITQGRQICTRGLLCPNGDVCNNLGGCVAPSDANGNPQCLPNKLTAPSTTISSVGEPSVHPVGPGVAEGRAYTQHLYVQVGAAGGYQSNGFATTFPVTGAYYRIHTNHSLSPITSPNPPNPRTCKLADMTDQIGCLVEASPCSLGYAGRGSTANADQNGNLQTEAININNQSPVVKCIQGDPAASPVIAGFTYPLSRKLYLSSLPGFANVTGEELQLASCETDLAQNPPLGATPPGLLTTNAASDVDQFGFIHIASGVNGGEPYCEDFNEQTICAQASNHNACRDPHTNFTTFPAGVGVDTTCGDGHKDPYEDCDPGAPLPALDTAECVGGTQTCSNTCRCN